MIYTADLLAVQTQSAFPAEQSGYEGAAARAAAETLR